MKSSYLIVLPLLMIAIGALGLGTSITAIGALGWRHVAIVSGTTIVILVVVTAGLLAGL